MAGLMESIFGGGVKQLTEQRRLQQEKDIRAQLALDAKRQTPILEQIGGAFGQSFGEEAARNIFGDREMEEAKEREADLTNLSNNFKKNSPEYFGEMVRLSKKYGLPEKAIDFADLQEKAINEKEVGKAIQGKLTGSGLTFESELYEKGGLSTQGALESIDKFNTNITNLGKEIEKAGIAELYSLKTQTDKVFAPYKATLEDPLGGSPDIPGIGQMDLGKLAATLFPSVASKESIINNNVIQNYKNAIIKLRSGAAVSESEAERLNNELGKDEISIYNAIKTINNIGVEHEKFLLAQYSKPVRDAYKQRVKEISAKRF
jgi:hypothetical protein